MVSSDFVYDKRFYVFSEWPQIAVGNFSCTLLSEKVFSGHNSITVGAIVKMKSACERSHRGLHFEKKNFVRVFPRNDFGWKRPLTTSDRKSEKCT